MGVYENLLKKKLITENEDGSVTTNNDRAVSKMQSKDWQQDTQTKTDVSKVTNNLNSGNLWDQVKSLATSMVVNNAKSIANLTGLGISRGTKNVPYYLENFMEQYYPSYEENRKQNFLNPFSKANEDERNIIKTNDELNKLKLIANVQKKELPENLSNNATEIEEKANNIETNLTKRYWQESIAEDNKKIQEEQNKLTDPVAKKLGEIAPSMGEMLPGTVLSTVNPALGFAYFYTSAGGSYMQDGLDRGMTEKEAWNYANIMATLESASETVITGQKVNKVMKAFGGKEISKAVLNSYGFNALENAVQEAVMEPAQELTAQMVAGNDKANWDGMVERMGTSALNGALMGIISNGATFGLEKSGIAYNKIKNGQSLTESEINSVIEENIKARGKETVENEFRNGANKVYEQIKPTISQNEQQNPQNQQTILPAQENVSNQNVVANNQKVNSFNGYTQKEIDNIKSNKISIAQSNEDITKFVNNSRKIPGNFKMYLGKIKESASNLIKNKLGINIDNYNISLKTDDVRKIFKDHGSEKTETPRGQVPITENDFLNIPDIINNPDSVSLEGTSPQGKPAIKFEKNINGNTVVVTYVSDKHNNLEMQTMYKFKNNKKRDSATALHENQAPGLNTSEMDSGTNPFINNSIPQNNNFVKNDTITNNYAQTMKNNTQNTKGEEINWNEVEKPKGKFRKHYQSIIESSNTTAEAKAIAKEMMGTDTYVPESNKNLIQKADNRIKSTNPNTELSSLYSRVMNNEKITDVDIAVGERLIEYYSKIGDKEHLQDAIHTTALAGTQAGRTVQAFALLNHMTPQGQVVWLQRSIEKANAELQQKYKNKSNVPQFELTQDMVDKVLNTKSKEEMFRTLDEVYEELGQQVPKSISEKIDEWRYFSMLANIKTHGRNIIGNVAMHFTQRVKDKVAGAIEDTVAKFNPNMERTHTLRGASDNVKQFAKNDLNNIDVQTQLGMNENKYNPQSRLQNARRTFKSDLLEKTLGKLFDINSNALEVEDNIGLKSMYVKALSDYITANKLDVNNITDAQLQKARQHAVKSAQEATFHQASALATALNQMGKKNNITKFALDSAVPFKKTPINVAKTGAQYSPVGLIKSAVYDSIQLRKGNITINQYIDNISKGLTGTGIAYMGYVLAEAGILKASGDDDDKKEKYDEEQGKQTYSIEIAGKTYSLDWLSPVGIPLFIGAEINEQFNQSKKEKNSVSSDDEDTMNKIIKSVSNIANASANAINPMSEMSMVSGLTNVLTSYNKENAVGDMIVNAGKSYVNQFVPTALGQLARTTDDYERSTKSTKTGTVEKAIDSTINQFKSKIPGLRQTLPTKTDIWGNDVKQETKLPMKIFNNFMNPSTVKNVSADKVDKELNNLYAKTGEGSIIPKSLDKKITINGTDYRLTNEEYAKYLKDYGKTAHNLLDNLVSLKEYKNLDDSQKQKAIENVYSYAKELNKVDYAKKIGQEVKTDTLYNTMQALENAERQGQYLSYLSKTTGIDKESEKNSVLKDSDFDNTTKSIIYENTTGKDDKVFNTIKTTVKINQYLDYKVKSANKEFQADKDENGKSISGSAKAKIYNYVNNNITGYENRLLLLASQYKLNRDEQQAIVDYVNKTSKTNEEVIEKLEKYSNNFEVKNGKVYFK